MHVIELLDCSATSTHVYILLTTRRVLRLDTWVVPGAWGLTTDISGCKYICSNWWFYVGIYVYSFTDGHGF